jgi:hypothetical protein
MLSPEHVKDQHACPSTVGGLKQPMRSSAHPNVSVSICSLGTVSPDKRICRNKLLQSNASSRFGGKDSCSGATAEWRVGLAFCISAILR